MRRIQIVVPRLNVSAEQIKRFEEVSELSVSDPCLWQPLNRNKRAAYHAVSEALRNRRGMFDGIWLEDSIDVIEVLEARGVPKEEAARAAQGVNELLNEYEGGVVEIIFHPTPHREATSMELRH